MNENKTEIKRGFGRKMTKWELVKCVLWSVAILLFTVWIGSAWVLVLLPFAIDVYWTKFIPWSWWRGIKNGFLREVMSWVDALVFALVAVWVLQNFFFQNFQIPTTSLEKTMLAGDYLLVSKYEYGPRVPMTPLSLPVFQHTIDLFGMDLGKSYLEKPQIPYRRMAGLRDVNRGDIVVFNFPGEANLRPVDRRENYVKRCIGLPGETIQIKDRIVYIDGEPLESPAEMQNIYFVYTRNHAAISQTYWKGLGIYVNDGLHVDRDINEVPSDEIRFLAPYFEIEPDSTNGSYNHLYMVNMTAAKAAEVGKRKDVEWVKLHDCRQAFHIIVKSRRYDLLNSLEMLEQNGIYPNSMSMGWTNSNFGALWIPKKGQSVALNKENEALYGLCIRTYEGNQLTRDAQGNYYLNGQPATTYTFKMDYYWMMGDNRDNSLDSRYWGFVPEDHIVGTPLFVWFSIDPVTGDWRWDRLFKGVRGL